MPTILVVDDSAVDRRLVGSLLQKRNVCTIEHAASGVEALARTLAMELEGTGVRVSTIRMGPVATEFGRGWDEELLKRMLASWKRFGLQRNLAFMQPESVAAAVVSAVTAPRGACIATIELQPEGPADP